MRYITKDNLYWILYTAYNNNIKMIIIIIITICIAPFFEITQSARYIVNNHSIV